MNRRRYLATISGLSTVTLAGCSFGVDPSTETPTNTIESPGSSTGAGAGGQAALETGQTSITVSANGDTAAASASTTVRNTGSGPTGQLTARGTFYDESGTELSTEETRISSLPAGREWLALVIFFDTTASAVADATLEVEQTGSVPSFTRKGLRELSSQLTTSDRGASVSGEVTNATGGAIAELTATVFFNLEKSGKLLSTIQDSTTDLPAGRAWRFEAKIVGEWSVGSHDVLFSY